MSYRVIAKLRHRKLSAIGALHRALSPTFPAGAMVFFIPSRGGAEDVAEDSGAALATSAARQKASASSNLAQVDYTFDGLDPWPEPDDPDMLSFFEQRFGVQNANLMFLGRSNFSVVAVMIRSGKPDSVVDTISAAAKEAADQCSGTRPALVVVHLIDEISRYDLKTMLKPANGWHAITHAVFKSGKRLHIDSVAFSVPQVTRTNGRKAKWLSGDLIMLNNPEPRFPCEEIRAFFRPVH
jgi:hypothetical protein